MGKFYTANEELSAYLTEELGLTFHDREEPELKYFTAESGKQVKLDIKNNIVTLLDDKGLYVDEASSYTDGQLVRFLED